jgi:cytochrome c oxidase cbb3-type subunit 3
MMIMNLFPTLLAATPGGAGELALIATVVLTALVVGLVLFIMLLPEETRTAMEATMTRLRQYLLSGSARRDVAFEHEFDDIRELDNRIPPWFTYLFVGTVVFAGAYMLDYHVFGTSKLSTAEYADEVAAADVARRVFIAAEGQIDETQLVVLKDAEALKRGGENYQRNCVSCHGAQGQGIVGPNLTDAYWIHGGGIANVYQIIKKGVPEKGMISWQLVFSPKQMQEIASFVLSLQGTNPIGAKAAQGELWVEKADSTIVATADTSAWKR